MLDNEFLARLLEEANEKDESKESKGEFKDLPLGEYYAIIDEATRGESKKGNDMITIKLKITDGEYKGRYHWTFFNLEGVSDVAIQIAIKSLDRLAKDFGIISKDDMVTNYDFVEQILPNFLDQEVTFKITESISKKDGGIYRNTNIYAR